jgi:intracellular sulfur oxidation DsrE/DsrF family protein
MNKELYWTDEELNRFIDGELRKEERRRLELQLDEDPAFIEQVREYRSINQALRDAYDDVEPPQHHPVTRSLWMNGGRSLALMALLLPLGFLVGWGMHATYSTSNIHTPLTSGISLPVKDLVHNNTVLHIDVDEQAAANELLDRVETILTTYADDEIQVEVVANAAGLNLLRVDKSAVANRVSQMMDQHDNLMFLACANTISRLKEKGEEVELIGRTHTGETALDHVVNRLSSGWTYVKI